MKTIVILYLKQPNLRTQYSHPTWPYILKKPFSLRRIYSEKSNLFRITKLQKLEISPVRSISTEFHTIQLVPLSLERLSKLSSKISVLSGNMQDKPLFKLPEELLENFLEEFLYKCPRKSRNKWSNAWRPLKKIKQSEKSLENFLNF